LTTYIHTYIHTYIRVFCIAHINSIESLCVGRQVVTKRQIKTAMFRVWDKVSEKITLILEVPQFRYNSM